LLCDQRRKVAVSMYVSRKGTMKRAMNESCGNQSKTICFPSAVVELLLEL
jgi:hypothetical protein